MEGSSDASVFVSDEPIPDGNLDLLGRRDYARNLAERIVAHPDPDSLVIAFTGPWGSGKSSLLNMVAGYLPDAAQATGKKPPVLVRFNPWNFETREQLMSMFFRELRTALGKRSGSETLEKAADRIGVLERVLTPVDWVSKLACVGIPGVDAAKEGSALLRKALEEQAEAMDADLEGVRKEIATYLKQEERRIVVVIDDIDRLDRDEMRLVFKLVKLTASFPYILYVLAFDSKVVEAALADDAGRVSGRDYLEKIVQVALAVPLPDRVMLLRVFDKYLNRIIEPYDQSRWDEERWRSLTATTGFERLFPTVRSIKRFFSSVHFQLRLIHGDIDLVDFIGLETIRLFAPEVYISIAENKTLFTESLSTHGLLGSLMPSEELQKVFEKAPESIREVIRAVAFELFPAAESASKGSGYLANYVNLGRTNRLHGPDTFDRYFLLRLATGQVRREEVTRLLSQEVFGEVGAAQLMATLRKHLVEKTIDNLLTQIEWIGHTASPAAVRPLSLAILEIAEEVLPSQEYRFGHAASDAVLALLRALPEEQRGEARVGIVKSARGLAAWMFLAEDAMPRGSGAGGQGSLRTPLSHSQAQALRAACVARLKEFGLQESELLGSPFLRAVLKRWQDWGEPSDAADFLRRVMADDSGFVAVARAMADTEGPFGPVLKLPDDAANYIDLAAASRRARQLVESGKYTGADLTALRVLASWQPKRETGDEPEEDPAADQDEAKAPEGER